MWAVFDDRARGGLLVFDEDPDDPPTIGDCLGWVAFDVPRGRRRFERLSMRTTWEHASAVVWLLYDGSISGPEHPPPLPPPRLPTSISFGPKCRQLVCGRNCEHLPRAGALGSL